MNKVVKGNRQTPIEIMLQVDSEGKTTAKALYEFLELDKSQYARWCKTNILKNSFAEENVDYKVFDIDVENLEILIFYSKFVLCNICLIPL